LRLPAFTLGICLSALTFARGAGGAQAEDSATAMVSKFLDAQKIQQQALRGVQMQADIDAQLPKLKEQGRWQLLRVVSQMGKITFKRLSDFVGDKTVQHEVIEKYLKMEADSTGDTSYAINPQNYKFRRKTIMTQDNSRVWVFELTPRRKAVGLFKGELWLDGATAMPLKETGTFVKTPSIFLKKVAFVNEYKLQDGISVPSHIECHVDTRIAGRADLDIHFSNVEPTPRAETAEVADAP
jgi:hypothetical protein